MTHTNQSNINTKQQFSISEGSLGEVSNELNNLDFYLGVRKFVLEEFESFICSISNTYKNILQTGRNNNSDLAVQIREYTDNLFEFIEDLQNHRII
ncbi:MAG: hypothetical protein KDK36_10440 [Leptospiraceae bacterium]|nr:hypothetical protein [Leptospiraceae bacterium]